MVPRHAQGRKEAFQETRHRWKVAKAAAVQQADATVCDFVPVRIVL